MKMMDDEKLAAFERLRPRLFGIAYRMLGSAADAEDLVQDTWLRWQRTDAAVVRNAEAWLVTAISRLAVDRLRHARVERERYHGSWLPEPIATGPGAHPERPTEIASDLSIAFLVLLERLAADERIAFILRDVFDADYAEIAATIDRSEAACRQVVHRARERVRTDRVRQHVAPDAKQRLLARFMDRLHAEDRDGLLELLTDATTFTSDGGGKVPAALKVLVGPERIGRFLLALERKGKDFVRHTVEWVNGEPTMLTRMNGELIATTSIETDGERIHAFYRVLNPEKLTRAM
jgi:RNA polymerase sigma-70 factor (ECF subfamily)